MVDYWSTESAHTLRAKRFMKLLCDIANTAGNFQLNVGTHNDHTNHKSNRIDTIYLSIYPFWGLHWDTRYRRRIVYPTLPAW